MKEEANQKLGGQKTGGTAVIRMKEKTEHNERKNEKELKKTYMKEKDKRKMVTINWEHILQQNVV